MKHIYAWVLVGVVIFSASVLAAPQTIAQDSLTCYLPLRIGNAWFYTDILDTSVQYLYGVFDTTRVDSVLYYLYGFNLYSLIDTIRCDSFGRVWKYTRGNELLLFDFTLEDRTQYLIQDIKPATVTVQKSLTVYVRAGHFFNCINFYFDYAQTTHDVNYTFAPDIGIVQIYGPTRSEYLLRAVIDGRVTEDIADQSSLPISFNLQQNYPNPFNPATVIRYELPVACPVEVTVCDVIGRGVATLVDEVQRAGEYSLYWNARGIPSGVYYYRLRAGEFSATKKMILVR